jgi:hypothetical protein
MYCSVGTIHLSVTVEASWAMPNSCYYTSGTVHMSLVPYREYKDRHTDLNTRAMDVQ